jgi:cytochrome c553
LLSIALAVWLWGPGLRLADASSEGSNRFAPTPIRAALLMSNDLSPSLRAALERKGDAGRGQDAYTPCAVCHMSGGDGHSDGTFPQLAGQHASVIIKQLIDIREGRRANPLLPESANNGKGTGLDLLLGAELYGRDCASCHGARGEGDAARFIPVLAGQHYGYMLRQIRNIGAGRRGNAHPVMVSLAAGYSDAELMALVDYASRIRDANREE